MPSLEEFMTAWTPPDTVCRTRLPASQYRTTTPKTICMTRAPSTVRGFIARRFVGSKKARKRRKAMPPMPHKICCIRSPLSAPRSLDSQEHFPDPCSQTRKRRATPRRLRVPGGKGEKERVTSTACARNSRGGGQGRLLPNVPVRRDSGGGSRPLRQKRTPWTNDAHPSPPVRPP